MQRHEHGTPVLRVAIPMLVLLGLSTPTHAQPSNTVPSTDLQPSTAPQAIRYRLQSVQVHGNRRTRVEIIRSFIPFSRGDLLDVSDPAIEALRWRLLGTGYFSTVRLRLERGQTRGWVVLHVHVNERNTLIVKQLAFGLSQGVSASSDPKRDTLPYAALSLSETNFLGLGMELSLSGLASRRQQGVRGRFTDPRLFGERQLGSLSLHFLNGLEFFGNEPRVSIRCPEPRREDDLCPPEVEAANAVVFYKRLGWSLGTGRSIGASTRYTLDWVGDVVNVRVMPDAASQSRGDAIEPIDFGILPDVSLVSSVRLGVTYDRRDDPALPSRGNLVQFQGETASSLIGSDYPFVRLQLLARTWVPMPWGGRHGRHRLRLGAFGGAIFGDAPFFHRFFVSDLSDLIPSRVMEMSVDGRPAPNLLGSAVREMRSQDLAARVDVEYGIPLYRGDRFFRAVQAYALTGLYALANRDDIRVGINGYSGAPAIPADITFDLGIRADTEIGTLQLGFSTALGFFQP